MERGATLAYEYRGLMAETWDFLRGDPSGRDDRDFYLGLIAQVGQPVLDAGCGTGRLLLDYLDAGIDIDGVDISPEMLRLCHEKAETRGLSSRLFEQALESLSLPRRYRIILASSSVLQLITGGAAVRDAMEQLHAHLLPGGMLIAPFMTLWKEGLPLQREWENVRIREEDGAMLQRMGRVWYDPKDACEHTEDLYQVLIAGELVAVEHHRRSPASRSYTQEQARALFEDAGFREIHVVGGFTQRPATAGDMLFTLLGVK
ncbi:MAG: class I SAM-dependent methyltransferase [Caldilineaceae bacterium]|nr:class I SAM-dependent methyltransferase [Caldilineaceae bacterium]